MFSELRIQQWLAGEIESVSSDERVIKSYLAEVVKAANFLSEHWDEPDHGIEEPLDDDGHRWSK